MGWAKFYEDNLEASAEALRDSCSFDKVGNYVTKNVEPPVFNCNYCNLSFHSKKDLYEHIKQKHNVPSSIMLVNGKIIKKECYVKELWSVKIIRYDLNNPVLINGIHIGEYDILNEIELTDRVYQVLLLDKHIIITIGKKDFKISLISQESINADRINTLISRWSMETSKNLHIDKNYVSFNEIECICLDGLYNYFIACVATGKDKQSRYNDAYAVLSGVVDVFPTAIILLKIIAFRFNWIERLRALCVGNDYFSTVYDFMTGTETIFPVTSNGNCQIFIEDELDETIQCIIAYQNKKYDDVKKFIGRYSLRSVLEIEDCNQRDRVCLLCARMAKRELNNHEALRYYNEIQTPFFEEERKDFIKTL